MFDWLSDEVANSFVGYLALALAAGGDVLLPLIPSETMVIAAGVLAADGDLSLGLVIPVVALGAFAGDNVMYLLGRRVGDPLASRLFRSDAGRARLRWAERAIDRRGAAVVMVGRFIPGGRTVSTFACGTLELPWWRFARADAVAALLWAVYASMLGYLGGVTFRHELLPSLAATLSVAALVTLAIELWRRLQARRGRDLLGDELEGSDSLPADERHRCPR